MPEALKRTAVFTAEQQCRRNAHFTGVENADGGLLHINALPVLTVAGQL